ncbi:MAG: TIGR01777 family protein [Gammaproteobacteria bacterium]|nr:TIGR01777 family protein [Gammaproteobacteria bacterium]
MKILIAGGSGFIGSHLLTVLKAHHDIVILSRQSHPNKSVATILWQDINAQILASFDVVINLSGENIAAGRWSASRKAAILQSRVATTAQLVKLILSCPESQRPHLYNASAVGIYDSHAPVACTEEDALPQPTNFLSQVAIEWEQALQPAIEQGVAVTILRFAVVLGHDGGMMAKLWWPYRLGLAGRVGSGEQLLSWIHIDDVVRIIDYLLAHPEITGAINFVTADAVPQWQFAKTLATALHRPCWLPMPARLVKWLYGQMGQELLLDGQHVIPKRLQEMNYKFKFKELDLAIKALIEEL